MGSGLESGPSYLLREVRVKVGVRARVRVRVKARVRVRVAGPSYRAAGQACRPWAAVCLRRGSTCTRPALTPG